VLGPALGIEPRTCCLRSRNQAEFLARTGSSPSSGRRFDARAVAIGAGKVRRREVLEASAALLGGALAPAGLARAGDEAPAETPAPATAGSVNTAGPDDAASFAALLDKTPWDRRGAWEASWVGCPDAGAPPLVTA
jgi:hypothetical protein